MPKVVVEVFSEVPGGLALDDVRVIDLRTLNPSEKDMFRAAHAEFLANISCWEFDNKWFNRGGFYAALEGSPLWEAAMELWLALGVNQSQMAGTDKTVYIII